MNTLSKWLAVIAVVLGIVLVISLKQNDSMQKKYNTAMANMKAYDMQLSEEKGKSTAYQLTIDQLNSFQDSVLRELNATRKELRIKDKRLKALQEIVSGFSKRDTLYLKDTIFKEPSFALDTLIGDDWYNVRLGLRYPSTIAVNPWFKSVKHVVVYSKKETVNPPKKFWLFRLFQKKHLVLQVDVIEKNPYIDTQQSRYVEIIK